MQTCVYTQVCNIHTYMYILIHVAYTSRILHAKRKAVSTQHHTYTHMHKTHACTHTNIHAYTLQNRASIVGDKGTVSAEHHGLAQQNPPQ